MVLSTRQRLVAAARDELTFTGDLRITSVARRAGVSAGAPYRHFTGRNELLVAVLDDFFERLGDAAATRSYEQPDFAAREHQRLQDWVHALYEDALSHRVLSGLVGDGVVSAALAEHLSRLISFGATNIARAQRNGELPGDRDAELTAAAALGGVLSAVTVALSRDPRPPAPTLVDQLWRLLVGLTGLDRAPTTPNNPTRRDRP